jgi:hypothetical protein
MNSTTLCAIIAALVLPVGACGTPSGSPETTGTTTGNPTGTPADTPTANPTANPTSDPTTGPVESGTTPTPTQTSTPTATRTACPSGWNSLPKTSNRATAGSLTDIRSGRHACFDRLVIRIDGAPGGYDVRYVAVVTEDGSGRPVPLRGGARLAVIVRNPAYDADTGRPTYQPANKREIVNVTGYRTFRQVAWAGSFEGQTTIGVGVRARLPFRVLTLSGPSRIVLDTAHSW